VDHVGQGAVVRRLRWPLQRALGAGLFAAAVIAGCGEIIGVEEGVRERSTCEVNDDCTPGRVCFEGE
jgi:hypothetical protein